jgi:hypothetical protein
MTQRDRAIPLVLNGLKKLAKMIQWLSDLDNLGAASGFLHGQGHL